MYDQYLSTKDKIIIKQRKVKREEELALSQSLDTNEIGIHHDLNIAEIGKVIYYTYYLRVYLFASGVIEYSVIMLITSVLF